MISGAHVHVVCADAVYVTAASGFVAAQHSIGALQYMSQLGKMKPRKVFGDPAGCVKGGYANKSLKVLLLRQIRCGLASHVHLQHTFAQHRGIA